MRGQKRNCHKILSHIRVCVCVFSVQLQFCIQITFYNKHIYDDNSDYNHQRIIIIIIVKIVSFNIKGIFHIIMIMMLVVIMSYTLVSTSSKMYVLCILRKYKHVPVTLIIKKRILTEIMRM